MYTVASRSYGLKLSFVLLFFLLVSTKFTNLIHKNSLIQAFQRVNRGGGLYEQVQRVRKLVLRCSLVCQYLYCVPVKQVN